MFQKLLFALQIFYFAQDLFWTKEMIFEQYLILAFFIVLVNSQVFNYKFNLVQPIRGVFLLIILFLIGVFFLFLRQRIFFLNSTNSSPIWVMHSFMFYSIFYILLLIALVLFFIFFFVIVCMGKLYYLFLNKETNLFVYLFFDYKQN